MGAASKGFVTDFEDGRRKVDVGELSDILECVGTDFCHFEFVDSVHDVWRHLEGSLRRVKRTVNSGFLVGGVQHKSESLRIHHAGYVVDNAVVFDLHTGSIVHVVVFRLLQALAVVDSSLVNILQERLVEIGNRVIGSKEMDIATGVVGGDELVHCPQISLALGKSFGVVVGFFLSVLDRFGVGLCHGKL